MGKLGTEKIDIIAPVFLPVSFSLSPTPRKAAMSLVEPCPDFNPIHSDAAGSGSGSLANKLEKNLMREMMMYDCRPEKNN